MREMLLAVAVLVIAALVDFTRYNGHYSNAAVQMMSDISVHLWGK